MTIGDLLSTATERVPEHAALVTLEDSWSYRKLGERARLIARGLIGMGVQPGEHVGVLLPTGLDSLAAVFGVPLAGAVLVPINLRYRSTELAYVADDADLAAILTNDAADDYLDYYELLCHALPGLADSQDPISLHLGCAPRLRSVTVLGSKNPPGAVAEDAFHGIARTVDDVDLQRRSELVRLRDVGLLLYTSGTTAKPRGCRITHEALVRNWLAVARRIDLSERDRCWNPAPFFHITGIGVNVAAVAAGAAVLSAKHFDPETTLGLLARERATVLWPAYPPITQPLLNHPRYLEADLSSARVILIVAPPETMRQMQAAIPQAVQISTYGGTEHCGCSTLHEPSDEAELRATTCGSPLPGTEIRIADPDSGESLPTGVPGEILMRGVNRFEGYYKDPDKTARTIDDAGWMHTGDLGVRNARGYLAFRGRLSEMLKVGGENVAPAEVESHLSAHPDVGLVQVVGVPDPALGEVPAAFVELKQERQQLTEQQLIDHCAGALARFKIPRYVRFVTKWPMSATKIQKSRLRERLVEELDLPS
jgi:acyl-CoA synthetase (AMP-forming)/AMP-acid ligase II